MVNRSSNQRRGAVEHPRTRLGTDARSKGDDERERLAEGGTILAAMLAAAEGPHEVVDVVQTAPSDDSALQRVAARLGCGE
ncbi:MAG: hypothetical protein ACTHN8_15345 [Angustibacter sp.]